MQDIKLENALLDRASPRALLKLCDFGYSVRNEASPAGPVACHRAVGTPDYMVSANTVCHHYHELVINSYKYWTA